MKYLYRYRLLLVIYGLALFAAYYEYGFLDHPAATVSGLAQPPASAEVLIEMYPDSLMAQCLRADQEMYFKYDLEESKRLLENALKENRYKGDESYYYNYAAILTLLKEDASKVDEAVADWRRHDLTPDEKLDPRAVYKDRELPAALDQEIIRCVAMTRDGRVIVFAQQNNLLHFIDLTSSHRLHYPVKAHRTVISALAMAANDTQVVSASLDGDLAVWSLRTGERIHQLLGHENAVYDLAVFPDGIRCASVDRNSKVRIWDLQKGELVHELTAASRPLSAVAVSGDGTWLATAGWSGRIRVWSLSDLSEKPRHLDGHRGVVNRLVFTPDSRMLVSCSRDKTARVWDVKTGKSQFVLRGHGAPISSLAVSPNGKSVATASEDRTVKIWSIAQGKIQHTLTDKRDPQPMHAVLFTPDGQAIISNGGVGELRFITP